MTLPTAKLVCQVLKSVNISNEEQQLARATTRVKLRKYEKQQFMIAPQFPQKIHLK